MKRINAEGDHRLIQCVPITAIKCWWTWRNHEPKVIKNWSTKRSEEVRGLEMAWKMCFFILLWNCSILAIKYTKPRIPAFSFCTGPLKIVSMIDYGVEMVVLPAAFNYSTEGMGIKSTCVEENRFSQQALKWRPSQIGFCRNRALHSWKPRVVWA